MKGKVKTPSLSHKQIQSALDYNIQTGEFKWKISPAKNVKAGSIAGSKSSKSYNYVRIFGQEITIGRLAWFYVKGEWPERRVRFKNGDINDCRFENLTLFDGIAGEYDHKSQEGKNAYLRAYRKMNPQKEQARSLRNNFNLSLEEYKRMWDSQGGLCAICNQPETHKRNGKTKNLAVDHDHQTGKIRGLLCFDCNTGIGKLKEDASILLSAIHYLGPKTP
jgi:hypothetical protein